MHVDGGACADDDVRLEPARAPMPNDPDRSMPEVLPASEPNPPFSSLATTAPDRSASAVANAAGYVAWKKCHGSYAPEVDNSPAEPHSEITGASMSGSNLATHPTGGFADARLGRASTKFSKPRRSRPPPRQTHKQPDNEHAGRPVEEAADSDGRHRHLHAQRLLAVSANENGPDAFAPTASSTGGSDRHQPEFIPRQNLTVDAVPNDVVEPDVDIAITPNAAGGLGVSILNAPFPAFVPATNAERRDRLIRQRLVENAITVEGSALGTEPGLGAGKEGTEQGSFNAHRWRSKKRLAVAAVIFLALVAVLVGFLLRSWLRGKEEEDHEIVATTTQPTVGGEHVMSDFLSNNPSYAPSKTVTPTSCPTDVPSVAPSSERFAALKNVLAPILAKEAMANASSPQHRALVWLSDVDERALDPIYSQHLVQRYALATLFFAADGESSWTHKANFLSRHHECLWKEELEPFGYSGVYDFKGVLCSGGTPEVVRLVLPFNNITGSLPDAELGLLSSLESILMESNKIIGSIPSSLGNLAKLKAIDFGVNMLRGTLPATIGQLSELRYIYLDSNDLHGEIPSSLGKLQKLEGLLLALNGLTGTVPTEINNMTSLQMLLIQHNELSKSIPLAPGSLPDLRYLYTEGNYFTGTLPSAIFSYSKLTDISMDSNFFTGSMPEFGIAKLQDLDYFYAANNMLEGTIPSSITTLSKLQTFGIGHNNFSGSLPSNLHLLKDLEYLSVTANALTGTLLENIGSNKKLYNLQLNANFFNGTVPLSTQLLTSLEVLQLQANIFTGHINFLCPLGIKYLAADCFGPNSEVYCGCCDYCCNRMDLCGYVLG